MFLLVPLIILLGEFLHVLVANALSYALGHTLLQICVHSVPMFLDRIGLTGKYYMAHNMKKHAVIYKFCCLLNSGSDSKHRYIIF